MEPSETIASGKKSYARLLLMGAPRVNGDLEGDECGIRVAFQVDSFASGNKALIWVEESTEIRKVNSQKKSQFHYYN